MAKRFKTLNRALQLLRPTSGDANAIPPDAPEGTALRMFQTRHSRVIEYPSDPDRKRTLSSVIIIPFGVLWAATAFHKAPISDKAKANIDQYIANKDGLNHLTPAADAIVKTVRGFIPAKAVIFKPDSEQTSTKTPSKITGLKYNPRDGNSKTYPFGASATEANEKDYVPCKAKIATAVAATNSGKNSVSFKPEDGRALG